MKKDIENLNRFWLDLLQHYTQRKPPSIKWNPIKAVHEEVIYFINETFIFENKERLTYNAIQKGKPRQLHTKGEAHVRQVYEVGQLR